MNREQAISAMKEGKRVRRIGSSGHYRMQGEQIVFVGWRETVTPVTLGHWNDYELLPDPETSSTEKKD
jgi:hypothetical protein